MCGAPVVRNEPFGTFISEMFILSRFSVHYVSDFLKII